MDRGAAQTWRTHWRVKAEETETNCPGTPAIEAIRAALSSTACASSLHPGGTASWTAAAATLELREVGAHCLSDARKQVPRRFPHPFTTRQRSFGLARRPARDI